MLYSLQACRAAAAALVVLFHLGGSFAQDKYFGFKALDGPFAWGDAGVDFFFVLSGFLITTVHRHDFGRPQALGGYFFKRGLRIYPTYWLITAAVCVGALAVPALRQSIPTDVPTLLKTFALIPQDPAVVGGTGAPILFVAWSLQYEMLFYAVIALLIANRAMGLLAVAALAAVLLGCRMTASCGSFPLSFLGSNFILLFAMGVASAYVAASRYRVPQPLSVAGAAMAAFAAFGSFEVSRGVDTPADWRLIYGVLSAAVIVALAQAEASGRLKMKQRWIGVLGDASYALYLLHIPVISLLCKLFLRFGLTQPAAIIAAFIGIFLACVACSVVFHLAIERPMLGFFRSRWGQARATVPARAGIQRGTQLP